ncbi:hypothetical protein Tco_0080390 [Tanacetum coccineum]
MERSIEEGFLRCGRTSKWVNEPILALPSSTSGEKAIVDVVRGVEVRVEAKNEFEIDVRRSDLAYSRVEIEYQGSSGLLLQPELPK